MVRKAIAPNHLLEYLQSQSKNSACSFGLILGQPADEKDYVLHFTRTPLNSSELLSKDDIKTVAQIPELSVAEHSIHTTRMLPGGLYVLGLFFITKESIFKPLHKKLVTTLQQVQAKLSNSPWLYGNHANSNEKLILHYNPKSSTYEAQTLNINSGTTHIVNFTFSDKEPKWRQIECKFDFNDVVQPIPMAHSSVSLKNQMKSMTNNLNNSLKYGTFIYDGVLCNPQDKVGYGVTKRPRERVMEEAAEDMNVVTATILLPTTTKTMYEAEVTNNAGSVRIIGQIASSIWLNPETTYETVSRALIEDIVRSFQARLSMHFDSLTEGESSIFNDTCSLHEPPRRVQIALPIGEVALSDYLFPGEGPQEAQISFQDVLDVHIVNKHVIKDIEGQADLSAFYNDIAGRDSCEPLPSLPTDTNKFMYMVGAGVAVGVLVLSLLIHFFREYETIE